MQGGRQAGVGALADRLFLGDDDPLAADGSLSGGDCQHDARVLDVLCRERGGRAVRGGDLFGREPRRPNRERGELALDAGEAGRPPVGVEQRVAL